MSHSNRYSVALTTAATAAPVSLGEVKSHLDIPDSDETKDPNLIGVILAVTASLENYTRRTFVTTTFTLWRDRFPGRVMPWWDGVRQGADTELTDLTGAIEVPRPPLISVTHIKSHLQDGSESTFSSANYLVDTVGAPGRIVPKVSQAWPSTTLRAINGVEVEYVAGYGPTGSDVPAPIRQAILMMIGDINSKPEATDIKFERVGDSAVSRFDPSEIQAPVKMLLSDYRIWKV